MNTNNRLANLLLGVLADGHAPWEFPFLDNYAGIPTNPFTRRKYGIVNSIFLQTIAYRYKLTNKYWATRGEWQSLNRKISESALSVKTSFGGKTVELVNGRHVMGLGFDTLANPRYSYSTEEDLKRVHNFICATGATVQIGYGLDEYVEKYRIDPKCGWYIPPMPYHDFPEHEEGDFIYIPGNWRVNEPFYYSVVLHELIHWSAPRLGWLRPVDMGELAAEIGAAFLSAELGLQANTDKTNFNSFCQKWYTGIRKDFNYFIDCATFAGRAIEFLLLNDGQFVQPSEDFEAVSY